jgi:hypothetical protein
VVVRRGRFIFVITLALTPAPRGEGETLGLAWLFVRYGLNPVLLDAARAERRALPSETCRSLIRRYLLIGDNHD